MENFLEILFATYKKLSVENIEFILLLPKLFICIFGGLIITITHSFFSYQWLRNNFNLYVGMSLPIIGLLITTVIGSNIALSIGMLGALSIVRFRPPIRTPYELVHYFGLLTLGISCKVDIAIALVLTFILSILPFFIQKFSRKNNKLNDSKKIIINLKAILNENDIKLITEENSVKNYTVEKKDNLFNINLLAHFEKLSDQEIFLKKWSSKIKSYDVSLDEIETNY